SAAPSPDAARRPPPRARVRPGPGRQSRRRRRRRTAPRCSCRRRQAAAAATLMASRRGAAPRMSTMPVPSTHGQAAPPTTSSRPHWFAPAAGRALLHSELAIVHAALGERPGQPWLWLAPSAPDEEAPPGHGLRLQAVAGGWAGTVRCTQALPLANESVACVVLQHAGGNGE